MALDKALLPNLKNLDPSFLKPSYDPTGDYHVIKDFGITMFFYNNKIVTDQPKTMHDFYMLLPKYVSKGRTNLLDGAEEVVPLALMALGLDPNTTSQSDFDQVKSFLLSIRKGVTTIDSSALHQRRHRRQDHPQPGVERRRAPDRAGAQEAGRHHGGHPDGGVGDLGRQLVHPGDAPHPVAAHAWINWLLTPSTAVTEMNYHNYPIPMPDALDQMPADLRDDPCSTCPKTYTDNYQYILNVSPQVVQARTADLHGVQGGLMAVARRDRGRGGRSAGTRRRRSFSPRYPAWLTAPSLLYYVDLLPGADGDPGGVLAGDAARIRQRQLWVRHLAVPADRRLAVRHDLRRARW